MCPHVNNENVPERPAKATKFERNEMHFPPDDKTKGAIDENQTLGSSLNIGIGGGLAREQFDPPL